MFGIELIYIGSAGHLRRYKVVDANGKCVKDDSGPAVFRTLIEAESFIAARTPKGRR